MAGVGGPKTNQTHGGYRITPNKKANGTVYYGGVSDEALGISTTNDDVINEYLSTVNGAGDPFWNSLTESQKIDLLKQYRTSGETKNASNLWGLLTTDAYSFDTDALLSDLQELAAIGDFDMAEPLMSDYVKDSSTLYSEIDSELARDYANAYSRIDSAIAGLDADASRARADYEDQLRTNADYYNQTASKLLSNQYLANAQTYDALQSDMRKSRQNALESGASAGIRLAGNINSLLTAQNKQSQTAMDTSNALAEMLLQQRNAAAGLRSEYNSYMSNLNDKRAGYNLERNNIDSQRRAERESLYNQRHNANLNNYNTAMTDYNSKLGTWENSFNSLAGNKAAGQYQNYYRNN